MTVLDFIEAFYKNEPGAKKITKENMLKVAREQFIPSSIKIGKSDFDVLGKFGLMTFKSATNPDDYTYTRRQVQKVKKDIEQEFSAGITDTQSFELRTSIQSYGNGINYEKASPSNFLGEREDRYFIKAIFNRFIGLVFPENRRDENGVLQGDFIKTSGLLLKKYMDSGKIVIDKGEITFKRGDEFVKLNTLRGQVTRALVTSLVLDIADKLDAKYPDLNENDRTTLVLLSTFITLRGATVQGEEEATHKIISQFAQVLLYVMENVELGTNKLREIAVDIANAQLKEFGIDESGEKYFQALAIESQLRFSPTDPKDVPSSFVREGGMYPYNYITIEGKPNYIPLTYFTPDSDEAHEVEVAWSLDGALEKIANAEIAQEALGGFYYFDRKVVEDFDRRPTFKTICEVNLTNLLILANVEIDEKVSQTMQQMFILPLIQSFDKLTPKEREEVVAKAMKNFRETGILPREAFAQIELLGDDRKQAKSAGKYGNFQRFELDANAPVADMSKKVAKRLYGILKLKKFDKNPKKSKERDILSKAAMLLNNPEFYFVTADGQCFGQDFQVWFDRCKQQYPEMDDKELETLLRFVYEPLQLGKAKYDVAKTKTKFTRKAAEKLFKRIFKEKPKDIANEAVELAFKKPSKNNPTITI